MKYPLVKRKLSSTMRDDYFCNMKIKEIDISGSVELFKNILIAGAILVFGIFAAGCSQNFSQSDLQGQAMLVPGGISPQFTFRTARGNFTIGCPGGHAPCEKFARFVQEKSHQSARFFKISPKLLQVGFDRASQDIFSPSDGEISVPSGRAVAIKNSENFEFFVTLDDTTLPDRFELVGRVFEGGEVLQKISGSTRGIEILGAEVSGL